MSKILPCAVKALAVCSTLRVKGGNTHVWQDGTRERRREEEGREGEKERRREGERGRGSTLRPLGHAQMGIIAINLIGDVASPGVAAGGVLQVFHGGVACHGSVACCR